MLILLPPSEGKVAPQQGAPLNLSALCHPELSPAREEILDCLEAVSSGSDACALLGVSHRLAKQVTSNRELRSAATAPAVGIYSGVLYEALDAASLCPAGQARAADQLLIFSALFGVLRTVDRIPAYRLSGTVKLPGIGGIGQYWRNHLTPVLETDGLIIDCRSGTYMSMWKPDNAIPVRVFTRTAGELRVVSHMAKHTRGLVARALLSAPEPESRAETVALLNDWFAIHQPSTASGTQCSAQVEDSGASIDVIIEQTS